MKVTLVLRFLSLVFLFACNSRFETPKVYSDNAHETIKTIEGTEQNM